MNDILASIENINKENIIFLFNHYNIKFNDNILNDNISNKIDNIYLNESFINYIKNNSNLIINKIIINIPNPLNFINNNIIKFDNNCLISSSWFNLFVDDFIYTFKNILPKLKTKTNIENIFQFTFFTNPNDISAIIISHEINKSCACACTNPNDEYLKIIYEKLNKQISLPLSYIDWFSNGNLYLYSKNILLLNIALTYNIENNNIISQFKIWKTFLTHLLNNLFNLLNNKSISILTFGDESYDFIKSISIPNNFIIYNDINPFVKSKPYNYLDSPLFFKNNKYLFE